MNAERNLVLIGMPGAGKSTLGVLLAKTLSRPFLDTDIALQTREHRPLQAILRERGIEVFKQLEEKAILDLACTGTVIATGGSVVYSARAMQHLRRNGLLLFLEISLPLLLQRVRDLETRGIVRAPDQKFEDLYQERAPLYRRHADIRIDCDHKGHEEVLREILCGLPPGFRPGHI